MSYRIRLALPEDAPAIASIYAPFCTDTPVSFEMAAPCADEMAQRIRHITGHLPWLVLEHDQNIGGYVYASLHRERAAYQWAVDVTAYISPYYRGKGIGRALYTALFDMLVQQGYFIACAGITLPNDASIGLHSAMGFEPAGIYRGVGYKLGAWHDVAWYTMALQSQRAEPIPPRAIQEIVKTSGWADAISRGEALLNINQLMQNKI